MVLPPGARKKVGVFATRSPHRPNNIGMSVLPLIEVKKRSILVGECDILDETPILDIKPYIVHADSIESTKQGWLERREEIPKKHISYSERAMEALVSLEKKGIVLPLATILQRRTRRIAGTWERGFILAYKTLRLKIEETANIYTVHELLDTDSSQ